MGTGTTESNLFYLLTVVQHMPTGAGGGGNGRPSSPGKEKKNHYSVSFFTLYLEHAFYTAVTTRAEILCEL